jgi:hypothetical protein
VVGLKQHEEVKCCNLKKAVDGDDSMVAECIWHEECTYSLRVQALGSNLRTYIRSKVTFHTVTQPLI